MQIQWPLQVSWLLVTSTAIMTGTHPNRPPGNAEHVPGAGIWEKILSRNTRTPVGLLVDTYRVHRAFTAVRGVPPQLLVYMQSFNSTGPGNHTWTRGEDRLLKWMSQIEESREPPGTPSSAYIAFREALDALAYDTAIAIVTSRQPSDQDEMADLALKSFIKKRTKLFIIWTGDTISEAKTAYQFISMNTGGGIIQIESHDSAALSQLRVNGSQIYNVILAAKQGLHGEQTLAFNVDSTVLRFSIILTGSVTDAKLRYPNGEWKQINKNESKFNVSPAIIGKLILQVKGNDYDIAVEAITDNTLNTVVRKLPGSPKKTILTVTTNYALKEITEMNLLDSKGGKVVTLPTQETNKLQKKFSSQLELASDVIENSHYVELTGKTESGKDITRLSNILNPLPMLPSSIEVLPGSDLTAERGQQAAIKFQVTNNRPYPVVYNFLCYDRNNLIQSVQPKSTYVGREASAIVTVTLDTMVRLDESTDLISLKAEQVFGWRKESVTKRALFRIGKKVTDSTAPDVSWTYTGDCNGSDSPDNCYTQTWGVNLTIQDTDSGLLQIKVEPQQLQLTEEFIVGSTNPLHGYITMSCCFNKVSLSVTDTSGNVYSKVFDSNGESLSTAELAAIILGIILLIIILVCVIVGIILCVKKRKEVTYYVNQ